MVKKFTIPFASQGDANDIPDALQVDGKVSFTQGFSYDYERPYDDPQAKDIAREDMNGLFNAITSAVGELQTLGASEWSNAISYPKGAIVYFEKDLYISQTDDNQNKPPQSWVSITSIANDSLKKVANLSDLTNKATARDNLGLGSSATLNKTDVLGTSTNLVATQKLVNDTKVNLESSINTIENTSKTFLVKSSNLSDLTNKTKARSNLGLGSSATLNKTDVLGTSTNLVATQKLVNDTKINLENSKWDIQQTTGTGDILRVENYATAFFDSVSIENGNKKGWYYQLQKHENNTLSFYLKDRNQAHQVGGEYYLNPPNTRLRILDERDLADISKFGIGQSWVDVTSERVAGTTYTNNTGKPIFVSVRAGTSRGGNLVVGGVTIGREAGQGLAGTMGAVVPNGTSYRVSGEDRDIYGWAELR